MTPLFVSLAVSFVATGAVLPLLRRARVLDIPNARSSHSRTIPRGGGIGVLLGLTSAVVLSGNMDDRRIVILVGAALLGSVGLIDDVRALPAPTRLITQIVSALAASSVVWWAVEVPPAGPFVSVALSAVWVVGYINAFNFMDGINGISALCALTAGLWYLWVGETLDLPLLSVCGLAVAGSSIGFLPWNSPVARIFLGDVGSYALGFVIALLAVIVWSITDSIVLAVAPTVVYMADTGATLIRRAMRGDSLTTAHREHTYQVLVDRWQSHLGVACLVAGVSVMCCLVAALGPSVWMVLVAWTTIAVGYLALPRAIGGRR